MRLCLLTLFLVFLPGPLAAQTVAPLRGWSLTVGADAMRFGHAARVVVTGQVGADLRPNGRAGIRATLATGFGAWRVQVEAAVARGHAEAGTDLVAVRDKTLDLSRYRLAPALERRVAALSSGELAVALAPTVDLWQASGDTRLRLGVEGRVAVRVPLGAVALENRLAVGLSGTPLAPEDLGDGFELRGLRSLAFGVGLRVPL